MIKIEKAKKNHYQTKTVYKLPDSLYRMTYYVIRHVYIDIVPNKDKDKPYDYGEATKDETGNIATNHVNDEFLIEACEAAWSSIPTEYRINVYDHIVCNKKYRYMRDSHENTNKNYVRQYIWFVAHNLGWI